jgi:hypothetical protein
MRLPTRLRVRTLMLIVALVAFGFGVTFELANRARRDRLLRVESERYERAARHWAHALHCRIAEGRKVPYRPAERLKVWPRDHTLGSVPPAGFPSWELESQTHEYWAQRIYDEAEGARQARKAVEARLLLP